MIVSFAVLIVSDNEMIVMIIGRYRMNDVEVYCWISREEVHVLRCIKGSVFSEAFLERASQAKHRLYPLLRP